MNAFDARAFAPAFAVPPAVPTDAPDADLARRLVLADSNRLLSPAAALRRLALDGRNAFLTLDGSDRELAV